MLLRPLYTCLLTAQWTIKYISTLCYMILLVKRKGIIYLKICRTEDVAPDKASALIHASFTAKAITLKLTQP